MEKTYIQPSLTESHLTILSDLLDASASDIGIDYGGDGNDDDDPTSKQRDTETGSSWGNLW